jgi:DNA helicase-2/ATP-dependent DNA helicase PcrA
MAKMRDFAALISGFSAQLTTKNAYELGMQIFSKTGFAQALNENVEEKERVDHVTELFNAIQSFIDREPENILNEETGEMLETYFPSLDQYMESVSLLDDRDLNKNEEEESNVVRLMTIHSAKGLEFDYVFVTGMEENLFPSSLSLDSRQDMEEERRLFYVALTRARKQVFLTMAMSRFQYGQRRPCEGSRFLDEIPARFLKMTQKASEGSGMFGRSFSRSDDEDFFFDARPSSHPVRKDVRKPATTTSSAPKPVVKTKTEMQLDQIGELAPVESLQPGVRVYHAKFGFGRIDSVSGSGPDTRAVVLFETVGSKTLVLKFAKLLIPK